VEAYISIAQIIISIALIAVIVMQSRSSGGLGSIFGGDNTLFRTRRGVEKTLFNFTILLAAAFVIVSVIAVLVASRA
jgi:preprotein translocase subunit SecG